MEEWEAFVEKAGAKLIVVDFHATWCRPCKAIAPKVVEMAQANTDMCFAKVDVDELEDLAEKYSVEAMPTFIFLRDGSKVGEFIGANADKLAAQLQTFKRK